MSQTGGRRAKSSGYMRWARTRSHARFNLATSGLMNYPLSELPASIEGLELSRAATYGHAPLLEALAAKCGVPAECVVSADGTSMANHLAMAALVEPGDEVLIEHPAYELLVSLASYLGARVVRFPRRHEEGFRLDPSEIEQRLSASTRLVVLTNLHNPSSAFAAGEELARVGELARGVGARVLVDEVYLDAMFERAPPTAFRLGEEFVTTNSLTKVYGLSGLRCGWVIAEPALAGRIWRLNDLFGVNQSHPSELLSLLALEHLDAVAAGARSLLGTNRRLLDSFLDSREDLECARQEFGTVAFPRLKRGDAGELCALLRDKYETTVVPGAFFEMPQHFRIGLGGDTDTLRQGLERLSSALDELAKRAEARP